MRTVWVVLAGLLLGSVGVLAREGGGADEAQVLLPLTLGIRAQESETEGVGDVLIPLWRGPRSMLLANIRAAASDHDEEELNIGVGVRHLVEARVPFMVGGFVFYDGRWTKHHNRFDQLGLSAEFLSDWVDARFNYYLPNHDTALVDRQEVETVAESRRVTESAETAWGDPYGRVHSIVQDRVTTWTRNERWTRETTTHLFENLEAALEGWDAEIGVRLPLCERFFETRVFGGYQYFDHPFGGHLKGAQGRIELRALEGRLLLDAQVFENRELNLSDWRAGVRMRLPFELSALAQKRNPFALPKGEGRTDLRWRFDEMLMRDPKIQIQKSGYVEDAAKRAVEKRTETKSQRRTERETAVLADGVTFVNADTGNDANPGTAEAPKGTIQGGVDGAQASSRLFTMTWPDGRSRRLVYVEAASLPYAGTAVIAEPNIGLWGGGRAIPGYGGKSFGGRARPVLVSESGTSLYVRNMAGGAGIAGLAFAAEGAASGLLSESGRVLVWDNEFRDLLHGVAMYTTDAAVDSWILGNRFSGNERAVDILAAGTGVGDFSLRVEDNVMADGGQGSYVTGAGYAGATAVLSRNELRNLTGGGLHVDLSLAGAATGLLQVDILDNVAEQVATDAGEVAIRLVGDGGGARGMYRLTGNRVLSGGGDGLFLDVGSQSGYVDVEVSGNLVRGRAGAGMALAVNPLRGEMTFRGRGNVVEDNQGDGIQLTVASSNTVWVAFDENTVRGNQGSGIRVETATGSAAATLRATANEVVSNQNYGIHFTSRASFGQLLLMATDNTADYNGTGILLDGHCNTYVPVGILAEGNLTRNNATNGLHVTLYSANSTNAWITTTGNVSTGNGRKGLHVQVPSCWGLTWLATGNTLTDNDVGMEFKWTWSPTMGRLAFTENTSMNNRSANLSFEGILPLNAQSNWWGAVPPDMSLILRWDTGAIDVSNPLMAPP
jgi:hypothetical protein